MSIVRQKETSLGGYASAGKAMLAHSRKPHVNRNSGVFLPGTVCRPRSLRYSVAPMHELSYFREHLAQFEEMSANRGGAIDFEGFRLLDRERRERITANERLKADRNRAGEEIARRKRAGKRRTICSRR